MPKEGIQNPRYKGFYSKEKAEKALELDTTNMAQIKKALEPKPKTVVINTNSTKATTSKSYKVFVTQNPQSPQDLSLQKFLTIQKILIKTHTDQIQILGLYIGVHAYFNQKFVCLKETLLCKTTQINCPCKVKFLFRKTKIDLEQFKLVDFEDIPKRFEGFNPSINEAINVIQAKLMSYLAVKNVTCPSNFSQQNYPTHVIKLLTKDHKD